MGLTCCVPSRRVERPEEQRCQSAEAHGLVPQAGLSHSALCEERRRLSSCRTECLPNRDDQRVKGPLPGRNHYPRPIQIGALTKQVRHCRVFRVSRPRVREAVTSPPLSLTRLPAACLHPEQRATRNPLRESSTPQRSSSAPRHQTAHVHTAHATAEEDVPRSLLTLSPHLPRRASPTRFFQI